MLLLSKRRDVGLEEVVGRPSGNVRLATSGCRVELQEGVLQCVVEFHYGCLVPTTVTVVGRREYCYHISVMTPVVSLHDELMRARHECESIRVVERLGDVLAESVTGAPG